MEVRADTSIPDNPIFVRGRAIPTANSCAIRTPVRYAKEVAGRCVNSPGRGHPRESGGNVTDAICIIDGCDNATAARGWCWKHYGRWRRHGDPFALKIAEPGTRSVTSSGYRIIDAPSHAMSLNSGIALKHRIVFYDTYGIGPHRCRWCGEGLAWLPPRSPGAMVVDHIDEDKLNNDPSNLAASCNTCNMNRSWATWRNSPKTHCVRGHEFDEGNTHIRRDGSRLCRACARIRERARRRVRRRPTANLGGGA